MKDRYLEITFRKGKPLAAYLYLTGKKGTQCAKTIKIDEGLIADYDQDGVPVGLEIISPATASVQQIKDALEKIHVEPIDEYELAPLNGV
ncbi:MAG: DUF2283 domain-containing protein [Candidatus Brocadiales bacterium]|nr:DUF2283 domain-containing protein [Candidatus Brocadiales bacterium]